MFSHMEAAIDKAVGADNADPQMQMERALLRQLFVDPPNAVKLPPPKSITFAESNKSFTVCWKNTSNMLVKVEHENDTDGYDLFVIAWLEWRNMGAQLYKPSEAAALVDYILGFIITPQIAPAA